jgi:hypothetical protein
MKKLLTMILLTFLFASANSHAACEITKEKVLSAQNEWGKGIESISQTFINKGDYKAKASEHIHSLYAYGENDVLFKPTLAAHDQFRETFDEALSYFVGGVVEEDQGFAIRPWSKVRWGTPQIITDSDSAVAMGNYFFTPDGSNEEIKVEYTFAYMNDDNCNLKITAHHSSLPFNPGK